MGFSEFKDVVAFGNNQLWRPLAAKVEGPYSGLPKNMVSLSKQAGHVELEGRHEDANGKC